MWPTEQFEIINNNGNKNVHTNNLNSTVPKLTNTTKLTYTGEPQEWEMPEVQHYLTNVVD